MRTWPTPSGRWPWMRVEKAKSGHPGMPMGMADVATVLFTQFLKFDASAPDWPDRDRFVLSAGHGSMLLYALLHLTGYPGMTHGRAAQLPPARLQDRRPSRVRPCAGHRDDHRSAGPGSRQCRRHGAGRAPAQRAARRRHRRSLHLCDRRRRLPDGGHQPGGDLARRPPQARQADRAVRRQLHLHRRADLARRVGRPGASASRPRAGRRRRVDGHDPAAIAAAIEAARRVRQADADRLQDHHRLRRADQAGQGLHPRRAARAPRRSRARARSSAGRMRAFEVPADVLAAWRAAGARGGAAAQGLGAARGQARRAASARCSAIRSMRRRSRR